MTSVRNLVLLLFSVFATSLWAQNPALVGYWHNWNAPSAPYIPLDQVDSRYNVIFVAFATPVSGTTYNMTFTPTGVTQSQFIAQVTALKAQGKRVGISIGGGGTTVKLNSASEENTFVSSMLAIINTYGFDAMDLDLESGSLSISGGTIANPVDVPIIRMISATKTIMSGYRATHNNQKLFLTMAPETAYSIGGQSAWSGVWGAYLPIIHALRDSLDIMMVQLYNSGSMYGANGGIYNQGTADFIVALGEAMIVGFNVDRWSNQAGPFVGLPANKIAIALPACPDAAGGGYIAPAVVKSAIDYLRGVGPKPGSYTLINTSGYPDLRGMMTWSVNWDAVNTCGAAYEFAGSFETIFSVPLPVELAYFSGSYAAKNQKTTLEWALSRAENHHYFEIEHSDGGHWFETLGTVVASGNGTMPQAYQFIHEKPEPGLHHYRLRSVDRDGSATYSNIVAVRVQDAGGIVAFPNPFASQLNVGFEPAPRADFTLTLENEMGQRVFSQTYPTGTQQASITTASLPAGNYILRYLSEEKSWAGKLLRIKD